MGRSKDEVKRILGPPNDAPEDFVFYRKMKIRISDTEKNDTVLRIEFIQGTGREERVWSVAAE